MVTSPFQLLDVECYIMYCTCTRERQRSGGAAETSAAGAAALARHRVHQRDQRGRVRVGRLAQQVRAGRGYTVEGTEIMPRD